MLFLGGGGVEGSGFGLQGLFKVPGAFRVQG